MREFTSLELALIRRSKTKYQLQREYPSLYYQVESVGKMGEFFPPPPPSKSSLKKQMKKPGKFKGKNAKEIVCELVAANEGLFTPEALREKIYELYPKLKNPTLTNSIQVLKARDRIYRKLPDLTYVTAQYRKEHPEFEYEASKRDNTKALGVSQETVDKVAECFRANPGITSVLVAKKLDLHKGSVSIAVSYLKKKGAFHGSSKSDGIGTGSDPKNEKP